MRIQLPVKLQLPAQHSEALALRLPTDEVQDACANVDCTPPNKCLLPPGTCKDGSCWWYPQPSGTDCGDGKVCDSIGQCVEPPVTPAPAPGAACSFSLGPALLAGLG